MPHGAWPGTVLELEAAATHSSVKKDATSHQLRALHLQGRAHGAALEHMPAACGWVGGMPPAAAEGAGAGVQVEAGVQGLHGDQTVLIVLAGDTDPLCLHPRDCASSGDVQGCGMRVCSRGWALRRHTDKQLTARRGPTGSHAHGSTGAGVGSGWPSKIAIDFATLRRPPDRTLLARRGFLSTPAISAALRTGGSVGECQAACRATGRGSTPLVEPQPLT